MISLNVLSQLIPNIALLFALTYVYGLGANRIGHLERRLRQVVQGLLFGAFGVINMLIPITLMPGVTFDLRTVMIAVAAAYGGPITGLVAAVIVIVYRVSLGGAGMYAGIASALTCAVLGVWLHRHHSRTSLSIIGYRGLALLGAGISLQTFFWVSTLPLDIAASVLSRTVVPTVLMFPTATLLLGALINHQRRQIETEQALHKERRLLRSLIDNIPDYIFIKDRQGRFILSNISHAQGAQAESPDAMTGKTAFDFYPAALAQQYYADDEAVMASGEALVNIERQTVDIHGNPTWVLSTKVPLRDEDNQTIGLIGISRDISSRRHDAEALRASEARFRRLAEAAFEGVAITQQGILVDVNPAFAEMFGGGDSAALIGNPLLALVAPNPKKWDETITASGHENPHEYHARRPDGRTFSIEVRERRMDIEGRQTEIIIVRDLTDRKQLEKQQIELQVERERSKVLEQFVRDASHDLRTPLSVIKTSLYLLQRSATEQQTRYADTVETQVEHIHSTLESMLTLSRLDGASNEFQLQPYNLEQALHMVIKRHKDSFAAKKLVVETIVESEHITANIDLTEMGRAIDQLLENAISFTPDEGSITIRLYEERGDAVIAVQDTGIGIEADDLEHIFKRFYRADKARNTETGHAGLGLSIAKTIIDAHGGSIHVESAPGKGSTFTIRLPEYKPSSEAALQTQENGI